MRTRAHTREKIRSHRAKDAHLRFMSFYLLVLVYEEDRNIAMTLTTLDVPQKKRVRAAANVALSVILDAANAKQ